MTSNVTPPVSGKWGQTEQKMEKVCYTWTINNFTRFTHKQFCLNSPVFSADVSKTLWQLRVERNKNTSINILLSSAPDKEATAKYSFFVVNGNQEEFSSDSLRPYRIKESECSEKPFFLTEDFLFNNKFPEDKITIFCEMFVFGSIVSTSSQPNIEVGECKLSEDFSKLLDNEKFTDVTLVVDGQEFRAHKAILAARSAVFAAMFEHEFEERKSNCVEITDIKPEVLREMLHFIYTDKAPNINKMAKDLLEVADKYALEKLNLLCEKALTVNLTVETAAETLIFADRHNTKQLKSNTLAFINTHAIAVMQTPDWQKMIETNAYLVAEAFQVFAAQQCPEINQPQIKRAKIN